MKRVLARQPASQWRSSYFLANVRDDLPPLAFGTKACSAGDVPKVPKAWWLGRSLRSPFFHRGPMTSGTSLASVSASGGTWKSRCWESLASFQSEALEYFAVAQIAAVRGSGHSNRSLWNIPAVA